MKYAEQILLKALTKAEVEFLGQSFDDIVNVMEDYANEMKVKNLSNTLLCDSVCPKCKFEPMIKVDEKYNCEMCGYVDGQTVA